MDGNKTNRIKVDFTYFPFFLFSSSLSVEKENKATITTKRRERESERFVPKKEVRTHNIKRPFVSESKQQQKQ